MRTSVKNNLTVTFQFYVCSEQMAFLKLHLAREEVLSIQNLRTHNPLNVVKVRITLCR